MPRAPLLFLLSPLTLSSLWSCAELPSEFIEGERVTYFFDRGHAPCPAAIQEIDDLVDALDRDLDLDLPSDFRIKYFHIDDQGLRTEHCGQAVEACTRGLDVFSADWVHRHEVFHAVLNHSGGAPPLFNEGFAGLVDCGPHRFSGRETSREPPIERALSEPQWDNLSGDVSGPVRDAAESYMRFVVETEGLGRVANFLRASNNLDDQATVRARFAEHIGGDIDQSIARWRASEIDLGRGTRCLFFGADRCDDAPILSSAGATSISVPADCLEQVVIIEPNAQLTLQVDQRSTGRPQDGYVFPCDFPEPDLILGRVLAADSDVTRRLVSPLAPGRYAAVFFPEHRAPPSELVIDLELKPPSDGCVDPLTAVLDDDVPSLAWGGFSNQLQQPQIWSLNLPAPQRLVVLNLLTAWSTCAPGCPLQDCRAFEGGELPAGDHALVLESLDRNLVLPAVGIIALE